MKTVVWVAIAIVTFAGGTMAWLGFNRTHRTQAMLDDVAAKRRLLDVEFSAARRRIASTDRALETLRTAAPATSTTVQKPATAAKPANAEPALHDVLEAHPELREWFRRDYRFKLRDDYRSFYRAVHLSSDQIEKFERLMLDAEEEKMDLEATLRAQGPGKAIADKLHEQFDAKLRAAQIELLGETGYAQLVESKQPPVKYLENVENRLALTASPLTEDQRDQLIHLLMTTVRSEAMSKQSFKDPGINTFMKTTNIEWPRVWPAAQKILSPSQFAVFKAESSWTEFQFLVREFTTREGVTRKK